MIRVILGLMIGIQWAAAGKLPTPPDVWKDYNPDKGDFKEQIIKEETKGGICCRDTYISAYVLGLDPEAEYYVYAFWNDALVGTVKGSGTLTPTLRSGEVRKLSIRKIQKNPQVLSTNRHIMQGQSELFDVKWKNNNLSGKAKVVGSEPMKIVIALNGHLSVAGSSLTVSADGKLAFLSLDCQKNKTVEWPINIK